MTTNTAPIELYSITDGVNTWRYTSSDKDYTDGGDLYKAEPIGRNAIESKSQIKRENLEVGFPVTNPMALNFLKYTPDRMVYLSVLIVTESLTYTGWKGRLAAVKPNGKSTITLVFESVYTSIKSSLLTQSYQRNCRHMLYGQYGCKVDKSSYEFSVGAVSASGYDLVLASAVSPSEEGYYVGGIASYNGSMRGIMEQTSNNSFKINDTWPSLKADIEDGLNPIVLLYPGCDRTMETCQSKFANLERFGGFPYIPLKNPFDGSIS